MSATELEPWKTCLKHLQTLKAYPYDEVELGLATNELTEIITNTLLSGAGSMSEAACRKLVNDKWPLNAFTAIAQTAQHQPRSFYIPAAVRLLEVFFSKGDIYFLERANHVAIPSLQASVRQQLAQSGLLQQLPALMIAAAVELSVQAKDKSFIRYGKLLATGIAMTETLYASSIRPHTIRLLRFLDHTARLWTGDAIGRLNAQADAAAAAMQLGLAVTRHMSAEVEEHMRHPGASPFSAFHMQDLMREAYWSMGCIGTIVGDVVAQLGPMSPAAADIPQMGRLLLSPQLVPCFVLQLTITALVMEIVGAGMPDTRAAAADRWGGSGGSSGGGGSDHQHHHSSTSRGGSTSSSSTRSANSAARRRRQGSSSSDGGATVAEQRQLPQEFFAAPPGTIPSGKCPCCIEKLSHDWQLACERYSSLTPCHHKLFQLLAVDGRAVLWAAVANRPNCPNLSAIAMYVSPYMEHVNLVLRTPRAGPAATQRQQLERQLHLLLPAVLLHATAALPVEHAGFPELCSVVCQASNAALAVWEDLRPLWTADIGAGGAPGFDYIPPDMELRQLLQLGCTLSAKLQQQVSAAGSGGAVAAAAAVAASAAAAGTVANTVTAEPAEEADRRVRMAKVAISQLVDCMCKAVAPAIQVDGVLGSAMGADAILAGMVAAEAAGEGVPPFLTGLEHGLFVPAGVRDQAVDVMVALERYIRSAGAAAAGGQPFEDEAGLVGRSLLNVLAIPPWAVGPPVHDLGPLVALAAAAGPGSGTARQLHSLFTSALKLVSGPYGSSAPGMEVLSQYCGGAAATCLVRLLEDSGAMAASAAEATRVEGSSSGLEPGMVFLGFSNLPARATPCDTLDLLPWAVLYGRCCLLWAQQLQQELPKLLEGQQEISVIQVLGPQETWQGIAEEAEATVTCRTTRWCLQAVGGSSTRLQLFTNQLMCWLEHPSVYGRLSAAGYQPQEAVEELVGMLDASFEAENSSDPEALTGLVQALQAAGQGLGCLATPVCCNNPACSSLAGATELQLVSGRGCICAGCRTARYCDQACQRAHWKRHKPVCKALAAAAAAKPGE